MDKTKKDWWKNALIYQVYPKSFQDTNSDGIGDLPGVIKRLDYIAALGTDILWLSPVYASPLKDNGYDISDYEDINPHFGNMADMERLIAQAADRDITIMMDLVLNHTSDKHPWFTDAESGEDSPYRDFYIWRDAVDGGPPNGLKAAFGGSAWTYSEKAGKYYYSQFSPWQPDLNWENPQMRRELYKMIRFWIDKGVGGFRLDVADNFGKEPDKLITKCGPRLHDYIKEMRREAFIIENMPTIGEAWDANPENAPLFTNPDGSELSMVFAVEPFILDYNPKRADFDAKWDLIDIPLSKIKRCYADWQEKLYNRGWVSIFLENHDVPRIVSRWGDDKRYRDKSAKMLAVMLYGMGGTPCVYQGQEIGMTNIELPIEAYDDLETKDAYRSMLKAGWSEEKAMASIYRTSRDNARTPMQWSDEKFAGFSDAQPWLPVNPNYRRINVKAEEADGDSVLSFYKKLFEIRKAYGVFTDGAFKLVDADDEEVFTYRRDNDGQHLLIVCNFTGREIDRKTPDEFADAEPLLSNYEGGADKLRPYEAKILFYED